MAFIESKKIPINDYFENNFEKNKLEKIITHEISNKKLFEKNPKINLSLRNPNMDYSGNEADIPLSLKTEYFAEFLYGPDAVREHITGLHLNPGIMSTYGVFQYDIEVAFVRNIDLSSIADEIIRRLREPGSEMLKDSFFVGWEYSANDYKRTMVQSLRYMDELGLAQVDWNAVRELVPDADRIQFTPLRHRIKLSSLESSFFDVLESRGISVDVEQIKAKRTQARRTGLHSFGAHDLTVSPLEINPAVILEKSSFAYNNKY